MVGKGSKRLKRKFVAWPAYVFIGHAPVNGRGSSGWNEWVA